MGTSRCRRQKAEGGRQTWAVPLCLLPSAFCLLVLVACRAEPRRPNVLLITLDTFRVDRLGAETPTLAQLASEGVKFENAVAPAPLTLPAHASILSGLLPPHHGVRVNGVGAFPQDRETLATVLSKNGWRTGAFLGAFVLDHRFGLNRGFDVYDDATQRDPNATDSLEASRIGAQVVDSALAWIGRADERPFFAWVHLYDAHSPYAPPAPYPQTYDGEIAYVDAQVKRLITAVDRTKTIVVIVGDHGESLGEHGELTHGLLLYEPTVHVPMLVNAPGVSPRVVREPAGSVDLAPTIASLAHIEFPQADGRNLADDLRAGRDPKPAELYSETRYPENFGWSPLAAVRRTNLKLISGVTAEVYDLTRDSHETTNILDAQRRTYRELQATIDRIRASSITASPTAVDAETRAKLASLGYVAPAGASSGPPRDPKAMAPLFLAFEEAMVSLNHGSPQEAVPPLEKIVEADPANRVFRSTLARAYRDLGQMDRAIALYREAVALAPNDADTWYNLATTLQDTGNVREAKAAIEETLKREPRRPEAHNALGVALASEGDAGGAAAEFQKAIDLDPRNARAFNNLGNALRALKRPDDAATAFRRAAEIAPSYPDPYNGMGVLLIQQGRPADAIPYLDDAIRLAPRFVEAIVNRAVAKKMTGDVAGAKADFELAISLIPSGPKRAAVTQLLSQLQVNGR